MEICHWGDISICPFKAHFWGEFNFIEAPKKGNEKSFVTKAPFLLPKIFSLAFFS